MNEASHTIYLSVRLYGWLLFEDLSILNRKLFLDEFLSIHDVNALRWLCDLTPC